MNIISKNYPLGSTTEGGAAGTAASSSTHYNQLKGVSEVSEAEGVAKRTKRTTFNDQLGHMILIDIIYTNLLN